MNAGLARVLRAAMGDYEVYRILTVEPGEPPVAAAPDFGPADAAQLAASDDAVIRDQAWYLGENAHGYVWRRGDRIVAACFYWHGDRYRRRNFWPLADGQAKLVQIVTVADMRGQGIARQLIEHSARCMAADGYRKLFARVWHSNRPSLSAFAAAGWRSVSWVVVVNPLRGKRPWRLVFGKRPATASTPSD